MAVNAPTPSPATRRDRWTRRIVYGSAAIAMAAVVTYMDAPYADVDPGPTPELSELIAAENDAADLDPTFGVSGEWHATTINATTLSWGQLAWCKTFGDCDVFPLSTGPSSSQAAAQSMAQSVQDARTVASTWTGGSADHATVMEADMGVVGGSSAGLMLTLAFIDAATDGDLTGGRVIAGTGTINTLAEVGPVAGVEHKVAGALAIDADVFFAPHLRLDEAQVAARGSGMEVVSVKNVTEALTWLCEHGGQSPVCASPALEGVPSSP